jgi:hypothetical protein
LVWKSKKALGSKLPLDDIKVSLSGMQKCKNFLVRVDGIASGGSSLPTGLAGISEWLSHQPKKSGES